MKNSLILVLLLSLPTFADEASAPKPSFFPADDLIALDILTDTGKISVQAADIKEVKVEAIDAERKKKCDVSMTIANKRLILRVRSQMGQWLSKGVCPAGFKVRVPARFALSAASGTGDIEVTGLRGELTLDNGTGAIRVGDVTGALTARTGTGDILGDARSEEVEALTGSGAVKLTKLTGSAEVKTGSGDVTLSWSKLPGKGAADVKTGSGGIALVFPEGSKITTKSYTASGKVFNEIGDTENAPFSVSLLSGSGNVSIRKPGRKP
ncbi:MAG: DUF4097 family beta strand repeat-containing protein [Elusimicrobiota bacterium]